MAYRVIGDCAYVTVGEADGNGVVQLIECGGVVPPGVADGVLAHLVAVGLIGQIEEPVERPSVGAETDETAAAELAAEDLSQLDLNELRALAAERKVDLQGATKKADIIAALSAPPAE